MMLSVDVVPVPTDEAVREVENRLLGVETNITNWQRKQNQNNNFSAVIPYDLEQQRKESKEFLDDLTTRDQRMMFAVLTMVHTAETKEQLWKRVRKYGAYCTGITQNVDDLLQSHTARTMLANSEFIIMLNQASTDRIELAKLLNISDLQMSYVTNVGAGQGLLKVGSSLVPFVNKFPRNTELYRLMTTKFGEV